VAEIINLGKEKQTFKLYPSLLADEVPMVYEICSIGYRVEEIEKYEIIFWHRLLKRIYGEPAELECLLYQINNVESEDEKIILRKTEKEAQWTISKISETNLKGIESGEIKPLPLNWKYFVKLPTGNIVAIESKNHHTSLYISLILLSGKANKDDRKEYKKFISALLEEATRQQKQLFNPVREFNNEESLKLYHIWNVYLSNYTGAEFMLSAAETEEPKMRGEYLRYDARDQDNSPDQIEHIDKYSLGCGTFFSSAISYYFMAFEGFINILFHAFLKSHLRDRDLNIEQRLDFEQKLRLMPSLCEGFSGDAFSATSEIYSRFKELKRFRNSIFHSKIEDSLKFLCFIEDGFIYQYDMDKHKEQFLPSRKIYLSRDDVIKVKELIIEMINCILNCMNPKQKELSEKYILHSADIPFFISKTGMLLLGTPKEL